MGGRDKAFVELAGRPLIDHVAASIRAQVSALAISANGDPARFCGLGCPVLPDATGGGQGPLAGILAGLDWAHARGADALATAAVDTPFPPPDVVVRLAKAGAGTARGLAVAASGGRLHPTFGLWPVALRADVAAALAAGELRLGKLAQDLGAARVAFDAGPPDPFFNINTPEDLARAEAVIAGSAA